MMCTADEIEQSLSNWETMVSHLMDAKNGKVLTNY